MHLLLILDPISLRSNEVVVLGVLLAQPARGQALPGPASQQEEISDTLHSLLGSRMLVIRGK